MCNSPQLIDLKSKKKKYDLRYFGSNIMTCYIHIHDNFKNCL